MDLIVPISNFFQEGGLFMYPILLVLGCGLAIAVERYIYLTSARSANRKAWKDLMEMLSKRDYARAMSASQQSNSAIGRILVYGLERAKSARRRDDIETAMEEGLMEVMPRLEKRTHYLATFANISTLLGLLGTVSGLIDAFAAVANADPATKAELLSASISEAMNCTAFGLGAAIPMMLIYSFLQSKTTELVDSIEMVSVKFLNMLPEPGQPAVAAKDAARI
jgi:biopolymer transport protein ExbB/TolQ